MNCSRLALDVITEHKQKDAIHPFDTPNDNVIDNAIESLIDRIEQYPGDAAARRPSAYSFVFDNNRLGMPWLLSALSFDRARDVVMDVRLTSLDISLSYR